MFLLPTEDSGSRIVPTRNMRRLQRQRRTAAVGDTEPPSSSWPCWRPVRRVRPHRRSPPIRRKRTRARPAPPPTPIPPTRPHRQLAEGLLATIPPGSRLAVRPLYERETRLPPNVGKQLYELVLNALTRSAPQRQITVLARERLRKVYDTLDEFGQGDAALHAPWGAGRYRSHL